MGDGEVAVDAKLAVLEQGADVAGRQRGEVAVGDGEGGGRRAVGAVLDGGAVDGPGRVGAGDLEEGDGAELLAELGLVGEALAESGEEAKPKPLPASSQ